jgi:cytochrome c oxidase cbb3-type subunit III
MYKFLLSNSDYNINGLALGALVTFFTIFVIAIVQIFFQKKQHLHHMSNLPLDEAAKKPLSIIAFLMLSTMGFAQDGVSPSGMSEPSFWDWCFDNIIILLALSVIVIAVVTLGRLFILMLKLNMKHFDPSAVVDEEPTAYVEPVETVTWWQKIDRKLTNAVPISREQDIDLGHDYDGIRELDNSLPPWWLYGFYLCILWSGIYIWFYHFSDYGQNQLQEYEIAMHEGKWEKEEKLAKSANLINEKNVNLLTDKVQIEEGQKMFVTYCASCHLETGGGSVGPNLTDEFWIHGGGIKNVFKTIKYGVPEKGMIAWKDQMKPSEIQKLASFILSLQGTKPPVAKEAQGEKYIDSTALVQTPAIDSLTK